MGQRTGTLCSFELLSKVLLIKGFKTSWIGSKLPADVNDRDLRASIVLTSASVHDSQGALLLTKMSSARVDELHNPKDAIYDAGAIYKISRSPRHELIILAG
jgi:hypothetical protein